MPLTMRPTGLGSGFYKEKVDYGVYCGEWCIGRIYETRTGPADLRWFWTLHTPSKPGSMRISNQVATLGLTVSTFAHSESLGLRRFISLSDDRRRQVLSLLAEKLRLPTTP
jgi:hypothetical protein